MAIFSTVPEKKRRWSKGHYENGEWVSEVQAKNNQEYVKKQRYKQKAINEMFPDFFVKYGETLNIVCSQVRDELENKLREYILERAYTNSYNADYWVDNGHRPTYQFANAWEVDVYVGAAGTLHFDPIYNWETMDVEVAPSNNNGSLSHYSLHAGSFGSARGHDMRLALADILNQPSQTIYYSSVKRRQGRWMEKFDEYCRTAGVQMFKDLCYAYGMVL